MTDQTPARSSSSTTRRRQILFGGDAVGRYLDDAAGQRVEIVGIVANSTGKSATAPRPIVYYYGDQSSAPVAVDGPASFRVPELPERSATGVLDARVVSPGYFAAMGFAKRDGRVFEPEPAPSDCRAGVLNREAADLYFGGKPVGGAIIDGSGRRIQIIGVVESSVLRAAQKRTEPGLYTSTTQDFVSILTLILGAQRADDTRSPPSCGARNQ